MIKLRNSHYWWHTSSIEQWILRIFFRPQNFKQRESTCKAMAILHSSRLNSSHQLLARSNFLFLPIINDWMVILYFAECKQKPNFPHVFPRDRLKFTPTLFVILASWPHWLNLAPSGTLTKQKHWLKHLNTPIRGQLVEYRENRAQDTSYQPLLCAPFLPPLKKISGVDTRSFF